MTRNIKGRLRRIEMRQRKGKRSLVFISEWPDGVFRLNGKTYDSEESALSDNGYAPDTYVFHAFVADPLPLPPEIAAAR